jgi:hypothetical protein
MGDRKSERRFRFLSDAEFFRLDDHERVAYIVKAQQELEERQRVLREQTHSVVRKDPEATIPVLPR